MTDQPRILILGTHNQKKRGELQELLHPLGWELKTLAEVDDPLEVEETGETFSANAALKATEQAKHLNAWVLGEDSGLCVDALGGKPGVYSARFSGEGATDEKNNLKLLAELSEVPLEKRGAYYLCHATLSDPQGTIRAEAVGTCRGRILQAASGSGGFGYDPLFEVPEYHQTFGQLAPAVKRAISHRSRAIRELVRTIQKLQI